MRYMARTNDCSASGGQEHNQKMAVATSMPNGTKLTDVVQSKKVVRTSAQHTGLTQVSAPIGNQEKTWVSYTTQEDIKWACCKEARQRFMQAKDTLMLQPPMLNIFGIDNMDTPEFSQILDGMYACLAGTSIYLQKLILHLKWPKELPPITIWTYEEYKWSWEIMQETMVSSPSSIHFRHYIARIADDIIGKLNAIMANVQLLSGTAPEWWKQTLNVMIEKLAGNNNIKKLWIIMLFEADFNNNKWLGWVMMKLVEHNLIAPEQYGSHQHKAAITQCLNKRLFYDYHRFNWQLTALCSNDAKSCYDCIILIVAALSLCWLGAPNAVVQSMIQTLAHLNHHVCMAFGNSEQSQGFDRWKEYVAGIGQGNGVGPQIWAATSIPLFNIMQQEGLLSIFLCALTQQQRALAGLAFVDNTDLIVNDPSNSTEKVTRKMQQLLTMWHGLLWATSGELILEKCFWYRVDFKWQHHQWKYKTTMEVQGTIIMTINQSEHITIPHLEPSNAHWTLGVHLVPNGNDITGAKYLQEEAVAWVRKMARANLSQSDAEFSLWQVLLPKVLYPLTATNFMEEQCHDIFKTITTSSKCITCNGNQ